MPPYPVAAIMLLAWPMITAVIFARMERVNAFIWSILLGYMFLPPSVAIDLPAVPAITKYEIASMSSLLMLWLGMGRKSTDRDSMAEDPPPVFPPIIKILLLLLLFSGAMTVVNNGDPLIEGITYRPGMDTSSLFAFVIMQGIELIPFFVAFRLLSTPHQTRKLLTALMIGYLIYSVPMLIEVRLSPQLNVWIYGYFPHDFLQAIRYGGFRPIVFMTHPIWVASFATMGLIATAALTRTYLMGPRMVLVLFYLVGVLILCKTMTAIMMAAIGLPLVLFASARHMLTITMVIAVVVMAYPLLRLVDAIPTDEIVEFIREWQPDRAGSLEFRFEHEFMLLERAMQRPLFGWGSWGRNFPLDPVTGRSLAIADGAWVIWYGTRGIMGYLAAFGLLVVPLLILWRRRYELMLRHDDPSTLLVAAVALMLALNLIELIPNGTLTPLTWLLNGTVLGHACRLRYTRNARRRWKDDRRDLSERTGLRAAL
ncbi:hypothetical protein FNJ84_15485 [Paracoccus sp. M683]|uniref:hypothetical protein n=1 Tax=Paracoccus sp. M683 TaxID=2594268 RepID=UPI00117FBACC|nr:hypothetical protein [Paracoccus sp. M683]TRW95778.1 hypothetical protein FNJ84_15485 [Paracoccus sp. M683]